MSKLQKLFTVLEFVSNFILLAAGVFILVFKQVSTINEYQTVAIILFVGGGAKLVLYSTYSFYKGTFREITSIVSGALKIVLACMFLNAISANPKYTAEMICLGWGLSDIALSTVEFIMDALDYFEDKTKAVEGCIDIGEVIFGILICIELVHGINGHVIFMAVAFIAYSLLYTMKTIYKLKVKREE